MQSKLLDYLPAIYHDEGQPFLNLYLIAFERILLGLDDGVSIPVDSPGAKPADSVQPGAGGATPQSLTDRMQQGAERRSLEETIDLIPVLFDPIHTPKDFLPWLAGWAALSLRADMEVDAQRRFIASIIQLYRRRGTKDNLIDLLKLFTQVPPVIDEDATPSVDFKKGFSRTDSEKRPLHFFKVSLLLTDPDPATVRRKTEIARALIEMEKPAHTFYELETMFPSMRIGNYQENKNTYRANLGVDTLINVWSDANTDQVKQEAKEKTNAGT
jgi:phage tail-like protein